MRQLALAILVALAGWTAAGVLAVPDTSAARRIGLLPTVWLPVAALAVLAMLLAWRRGPRRALAYAGVAGLCLLPWVPAVAPPAFLLWTGPLATLPWLGAAVAAVAVWSRGRWSSAWFTAPSHASRLAFLTALAVYACGYALVAHLHPGGDEPHYLIISHSLLEDGDLRIQNNHDNDDYAAFFPGRLAPDFLRRGTDGQIYSIHAPGLPALLLPAYAAFGMMGAVAFLIVLSALGTALLWRTAHDMTGDASAAWMAWAAVALSVPFVFHTFVIFPDAPASVLALVGVHAIVRAWLPGRGSPGLKYWVAVGAALAMLPWLHTRYSLLAGIIGLALASTLVWQRAAIAAAALLSIPVVSAAAWAGHFWIIYGTPSPSAPYGGYTQTAWANIVPGVTGLLIDGQFGLLATAPILAWAAVGLGKALFGRTEVVRVPGVRVVALTLLVICVGYVTVSGAYRMWWGGASAPARFAVPLVLSLGLPIAVAWTSARSRASRALMLAALSVSVWMTTVCLTGDGGRLAYNARDGVALWAAWASPAVDLALALPGVHRGSPIAALGQAGVWIAAAGLTWVVLVVARAPLARRCPHHGHRGASCVRRGRHGRGHGFMARHRRRTRTPLVAGPSARGLRSMAGRPRGRDGRRAEGPTRDRPPRSRGHRRRDQPSRDRSRSESRGSATRPGGSLCRGGHAPRACDSPAVHPGWSRANPCRDHRCSRPC